MPWNSCLPPVIYYRLYTNRSVADGTSKNSFTVWYQTHIHGLLPLLVISSRVLSFTLNQNSQTQHNEVFTAFLQRCEHKDNKLPDLKPGASCLHVLHVNTLDINVGREQTILVPVFYKVPLFVNIIISEGLNIFSIIPTVKFVVVSLKCLSKHTWVDYSFNIPAHIIYNLKNTNSH
jgi:hypothetical protein